MKNAKMNITIDLEDLEQNIVTMSTKKIEESIVKRLSSKIESNINERIENIVNKRMDDISKNDIYNIKTSINGKDVDLLDLMIEKLLETTKQQQEKLKKIQEYWADYKKDNISKDRLKIKPDTWVSRIF